MAADNKTLGRFHLDGIPPAPRGTPQIEVTFDIDANGILNVSAKDKATGKEQSIRIEASSGLTDDEIDKMKRDAEEHSKEDKAKREEIDLRNSADQLVYQTEKQLEELGDKVDEASKNEILDLVEKIKNNKDNSDIEKLKTSIDNLNKKWAEVSQKIYAQNPNPSESQQSSKSDSKSETGSDDNIEDADFEVMDDEK